MQDVIDKDGLFGDEYKAFILCEYKKELALTKQFIEIAEDAVQKQPVVNTWSHDGVCHLFAKTVVDYSKMAYDNLLLGHFHATNMINRSILENCAFLDIIINHPDEELWKYYVVHSQGTAIMKSVSASEQEQTAQLCELYKLYDMKAFFSLDDLEKEPDAQETDPIPAPEIRFENVSFAYPGTKANVLKDINVTIRPGEKVAIVGENGSGKSTFVNLLCGMFSPGQGKVFVGAETVDSQLSRVRDTISVVFQDFGHYETTIRDNITVSDQSRQASDDDILQEADRVNAMDVITQQPHGLDETLGVYNENSRTLSGGQWQKLALLRAAYRNRAKIMILDEPTAALDPMAETELYQDFASITGDRTTILISHRLGITSVVDRILVFQDGRIIEDGSHSELMELDGHYAELYRAQAQWYQN